MTEAPPQLDILEEQEQKPGIRRAFLFCTRKLLLDGIRRKKGRVVLRQVRALARTLKTARSAFRAAAGRTLQPYRSIPRSRLRPFVLKTLRL